jgi:protein-disulfide isomerase
MQYQWKTALVGGLIGAVMSLAVIFALISFNVVPAATDARLHNYLMAHPKLAYEMQVLAEVQEAEASRKDSQVAVDKLGAKAFFDPAVAYVTGPANAKNTFVEFYDYNCAHCRNTAAEVKKFFDKHKTDTRFAFIEFPIFGDASATAARISVAARRQGDKFLALHFGLMSESAKIDQDLLYQNVQKAGIDVKQLAADLANPAVDKSVLASSRLAQQAKFSGTPMFIVNGKIHVGEITEADLKGLMK